jgi:acetylornithine deacetylase
MNPFDAPLDTYIVQAVARNYEVVTGEPPEGMGAILPFTYTANDTCHLWDAGIPCLLYGPGVIRGNADEDDSCVIISEMVQCTKVLALTALEVCNQEKG